MKSKMKLWAHFPHFLRVSRQAGDAVSRSDPEGNSWLTAAVSRLLSVPPKKQIDTSRKENCPPVAPVENKISFKYLIEESLLAQSSLFLWNRRHIVQLLRLKRVFPAQHRTNPGSEKTFPAEVAERPHPKTHTHTICSAPAHMVHVMKTVDPRGNTHGSSLKLKCSPHSNAPSVLLFILLSPPPPPHTHSHIHTHTHTHIVMCSSCVLQQDAN